MCRVVYIASDRPLPLVPFEQGTVFYIRAVTDLADRVSLPHVQMAGAHSGCECGFERLAAETSDPTSGATKATLASREALVAYLTAQLEAGFQIELLTGWDEEESGMPPPGPERTPREVLEVMTGPREMERFKVIRALRQAETLP
ncbi:MAG: hypothetical protein QM783_10180 [Phycisphaerales bacterium]